MQWFFTFPNLKLSANGCFFFDAISCPALCREYVWMPYPSSVYKLTTGQHFHGFRDPNEFSRGFSELGVNRQSPFPNYENLLWMTNQRSACKLVFTSIYE